MGINYHLIVKGYAQRTGKRLFIHPGFFTTGAGAYSTETSRVNPVYLDFPWTEADGLPFTCRQDMNSITPNRQLRTILLLSATT